MSPATVKTLKDSPCPGTERIAVGTGAIVLGAGAIVLK